MRLARACHAEWTKLRTLPATAWLPLVTVVATAGLGTAVRASCETDCDAARLGLTGVYLGQLAVVALAVLAAAGECRATTLTAIPARAVAFTAKALAVTAAVLPAALVAVAASTVAGPDLDGRTLRAGLGTVAYLVLIALLALGVAATLQRTAAALSTVLGLLYLAPIATQFVTDERWRTWIERAAPGNPRAGLAALAGWTAAALAAGALTFVRRDAAPR
ncbi:ABC transporter permease [Phytohabitans sp. LJ34]|uniref:ABC transporter permease n=1 Tax=Phytohabitans sp. LJ34 TaxID=3452217 RepID=UPI003F8ABF2F